MAQPPLWRRLYDTVERAVAPRLESVVRTEQFARGTALAWPGTGHRPGAGGRTVGAGMAPGESPAGTDIARLRTQIGALDREVRRLALRLEQEAHHDAHPDGKETDGAGARPP